MDIGEHFSPHAIECDVPGQVVCEPSRIIVDCVVRGSIKLSVVAS